MLDIIGAIIVIALSGAAGIFTTRYLTAHPVKMSRYLLGACLAAFAVVAILVLNYRGWVLAALGGAAVVAFAIGYLWTARIVLAREDGRFVPELVRAKGDPGAGHVAIVYFTHGEPENYDPIGWLNQFREFDKERIPFVPFFVRPIFLYRLRNSYLHVGQSHHRQGHRQMIEKLEGAYRAQGDTSTRFYLSFLDDEPRPDAALILALNDGAGAIVVAEVFVSISNHTAEGESQINSVHAETLGVPVAFTGPLWDSPTLHRMFLEKANAAIGATDKAKVGVLLVGHGQPDEWDREFPTETEHELAFRRAILEVLVADGYRRENLGLAWMEFKKPQPAPFVEKLVQNGVEKILYFSAAISADAIHSQHDTPELMHRAKLPASVPLINLGAWNDHPLAIQAIKEKIDAVMPASFPALVIAPPDMVPIERRFDER
jgi:sirohydrochlorin ferrochelatase